MTRFLAVVALLALFVGCERDFHAGPGYGPKPAYSGAGSSYATGGGLIAVDDAIDSTSTPKDTQSTLDTTGPTDTAGIDTSGCGAVPDTVTAEYLASYCLCITDGNDEGFCKCKWDICKKPKPVESSEEYNACLGAGYSALIDCVP